MHNTQNPEKRDSTTGAELDVHSIFYTIQGEGPYSGVPAVFIRLAGCNLQCPGCDTEYTATRKRLEIADIYNSALALFPSDHKMPKLMVITGGEPFRQFIEPLLILLVRGGGLVQIETNGTFAPTEIPKGVRVVCSPKAGKVAKGLIPFISAYKYVIDANSVSTTDGLPTRVLGGLKAPARPHDGWTGPIYVTPLDVADKQTNSLNVDVACRVALRYGYIMQIQLHKYLLLP